MTAAVLMISCNSTDKGNSAAQEADQSGEILSVSVEEIVAQPAAYDGRQVAVSGMVTHVCREGGQKCFVVGEDGETQIRIVPGGDIDEFKIDLEGSTVAFRGVFKMQLNQLTAEQEAEHKSMVEQGIEMAHSEAEQADFFIEATTFAEVTP